MKKITLILAAVFFTTAVNAQTTQSLQSTQGENMKTIIIYSSTTGFTKQYAQWIFEATGFETIELKSATEDQIQSAERVVFGSSIMADHIRDLDKLQKMNPKNLVLFAVGLTEKSNEYTNKLAEINQTGNTPLFYMRGGAHLKKLNFFARLILKKVSGIKEDVDYSDKAYINELVEFLK